MFDNCLTSQCTGESLKVLTKIKTKGFCKCLTSDSPQPPSPKCIHCTGESLKPATSDNNCASNPDTIKPYLFIWKFANQPFSLTPIWMYGITQQHTFICNELQFDRFFFLVFFFLVFSCAAAADSVDYFLVLIFLCTAWLLLITGGSSNRLCPISNRVCKAVSSIFSDFCFQYFFFPGTFTGG